MTIQKGSKIKVWVKDHKIKGGKEIQLFSTSVGSKQMDGTYINAFLPISLSNKVDKTKLHNGVDVEIVSAWLSVTPTDDGKNSLRLFINELNVITEPF